MHIITGIRNAAAILLCVLLLLSALSGYGSFTPPKSILTVPFRMALDVTLKIQLILLPLVCVGCGVFFAVSGRRPGVVGILCVLLLAAAFILDVVTALRLKRAKSEKSVLSYTEERAGRGRTAAVLSLTADYAKKFQVAQCAVYRSAGSAKGGTCLIYMNYGGWSAQDESSGKQIQAFCRKEGYSFVRFATKRGEHEQIASLVKKAGAALEKLLAAEAFDHVYLCGDSAGAHIALLCAGTKPAAPNSAEKPLAVDGVIALSPCIDPGFCYDYYVNADARSLGARAGNAVYHLLMGGRSLAEATKTLDESVFGVRGADNAYYESAAVRPDSGMPVLAVQCGADSMMPCEPARNWYAAAAAAGAPAVYLELPGTEHVVDAAASAAWDRCEAEMTGFVRAVNAR